MSAGPITWFMYAPPYDSLLADYLRDVYSGFTATERSSGVGE